MFLVIYYKEVSENRVPYTLGYDSFIKIYYKHEKTFLNVLLNVGI